MAILLGERTSTEARRDGSRSPSVDRPVIAPDADPSIGEVVRPIDLVR
jgi:hypothetical protein